MPASAIIFPVIRANCARHNGYHTMNYDKNNVYTHMEGLMGLNSWGYIQKWKGNFWGDCGDGGSIFECSALGVG